MRAAHLVYRAAHLVYNSERSSSLLGQSIALGFEHVHLSCKAKEYIFIVSLPHVYARIPIFLLDITLITTRKMDATALGSYVVYALVLKETRVIQLIASLIPSYHGVCLIPVIDTTTGQVFMADWNGTDTLVQPSPILNQWENK